MRTIVLLLAVFVATQTDALSVPDSVMTGPYKVSFDIGLSRDEYNVTVNEPRISETLSGIKTTNYQIEIVSINITKLNESGFNETIPLKNPTLSDMGRLVATGGFNGVTIGIEKKDEALPTIAGNEIVEALEEILESYKQYYSGIRVVPRTIDEASGAVASTYLILDPNILPIEMYQAMYLASFDPKHVVVLIQSTYPWDDNSRILLKTIHVEKVK